MRWCLTPPRMFAGLYRRRAHGCREATGLGSGGFPQSTAALPHGLLLSAAVFVQCLKRGPVRREWLPPILWWLVSGRSGRFGGGALGGDDSGRSRNGSGAPLNVGVGLV